MSLAVTIGVSLIFWTIMAGMSYSIANAFAGEKPDRKKFILILATKTLLVDVGVVAILSGIFENNIIVDVSRFLATTIGTMVIIACSRRYMEIKHEKLFFVMSMTDMWKFICCYFAGEITYWITGVAESINRFYDTLYLNMIRILFVFIIVMLTIVPMIKLSEYISDYRMRWPNIGKILIVGYFIFVMISNITPVAYYGIVILPEVTIGVIIIAIMSNYTFHVENNRMSMMMEMMEYERNVMVEYCDTLDKQISLTKKLRHDLKNNAQIILTLCEEENYVEMKRFVESWKDVMDEVYIKKYCEFQVVNAALSQKEKVCNQLGIKLNIEMGGLQLGCVDEFDFSTVIFNLMDNAINGCKAVDEGERFISLKCKNMYNQILIIVKNSCNTLKPYKKLDDVEEHGLGLNIVNTVVNKYAGSINLEDSGNIYKVDINLDAQPKK